MKTKQIKHYNAAYVLRVYVDYTIDDNGNAVAYQIDDYTNPMSYWYNYYYQTLTVGEVS